MNGVALMISKGAWTHIFAFLRGLELSELRIETIPHLNSSLSLRTHFYVALNFRPNQILLAGTLLGNNRVWNGVDLEIT